MTQKDLHPGDQLPQDPAKKTLVVLGSGWGATSFLKSLDTEEFNVVSYQAVLVTSDADRKSPDDVHFPLVLDDATRHVTPEQSRVAHDKLHDRDRPPGVMAVVCSSQTR